VAADNLAVRAQAFSGALVPLVLAVAFTLVQVLQHSTSEHVHRAPESAAAVWLNFSGTAVYVTFASVAAVNTLVTVLLARRRELAVIRLAGAGRARTLAIVLCEAVVVTGTGLVMAAGVAAATLLPILHASLGTWVPYLQPGPLAGIVLTAAAVVGLGTAVPAAVVLHRPAVESVALAR
jgi:putative ABC transport system permease protein